MKFNCPHCSESIVLEYREVKKRAKKESFDFEAVYSAYPRKKGRTSGLSKFKAQITSQALYDAIIKAVNNFAKTCKEESTEECFIPYFSTWMNDWKDYVEVKEKPVKSMYRQLSKNVPIVTSIHSSHESRIENEKQFYKDCKEEGIPYLPPIGFEDEIKEIRDSIKKSLGISIPRGEE